MDTGVGHQMFLCCDGEVRSVRDTFLISTSFNRTSVHVGVEVYHGHGSVYLV